MGISHKKVCPGRGSSMHKNQVTRRMLVHLKASEALCLVGRLGAAGVRWSVVASSQKSYKPHEGSLGHGDGITGFQLGNDI